MESITFIGNCQTASLCFYFQQLLVSHKVRWVMYGDEFAPHFGGWSDKIKDKILDYDIGVHELKESDVIIYQEISTEKSAFANTQTLLELKKPSCVLIRIPVVYLDYSDYTASIEELRKREVKNKVDVRVSDILEKYRDLQLVRNIVHPTTFLFLEIVDELCKILKVNTFSEIERSVFLTNENYMGLP